MSDILTKYEKETILLTSEGDDTYDIYTFNPALKRRLAAFSKEYPKCCWLRGSNYLGAETYRIEKSRRSIRLLPPLSDERKKALSRAAKKQGLGGDVRK